MSVSQPQPIAPAVVETPKKKPKKAALLNTIMASFIQMKWRNGITQMGLKNYLLGNYHEDLGIDVNSQNSVTSFSKRVTRELKKGVDKNIFVKVDRRYKLNKNVRKSICNSVKKLASPSKKIVKKAIEEAKKPKTKLKVLTEAEKDQLRMRVEKAKVEKEKNQIVKYFDTLKTIKIKPEELSVSNKAYHFSLSEMAKEKFIFDETDEQIENEDDIIFKLNKRQMSKVILIAEFCNYFSSKSCLKLTKFSLKMLIKSLLDNKVNVLIREMHFALLDLILSPENLIFLIKNNLYKRNEEFMCRYEKLLLLDLYSVLNITTWQEILRRFLIFCLKFNVSPTDTETRTEIEQVIKLLEELDYNFLTITQKLVVLEKLVEECNNSVFVRDRLQNNIDTVTQVSKDIYKQNKEDVQKRKDILADMTYVLEKYNYTVTSFRKRKAKAAEAAAKKQKLEESTDKKVEVKPIKTEPQPPKPMSLKIMLKENQLEDLDYTTQAFTKYIPASDLKRLQEWQQKLKDIKSESAARGSEIFVAKFWNEIRQKPIGVDSFKNEYYMLRSDLNNFYVYGNHLDLVANRQKIVDKETTILDEKLKNFDALVAQKNKNSSIVDMTRPPPPPPPVNSVLSKVIEQSKPKPRLSVAEREAIAKVKKQKNWAYVNTSTDLEEIIRTLNKFSPEERDLKTSLHGLLNQVLKSFPSLTDDISDDVASKTSTEASIVEAELEAEEERQKKNATRPQRKSAKMANIRLSRHAPTSSSKSKKDKKKDEELAKKEEEENKKRKERINFRKMLLFHQQEDSYEKYENRLSSALSLEGISVLDFGLDLLKNELAYCIKVNHGVDEDSKVDIDYEFNRIRVSRHLDGGEHSDYLLNWIICELVALAQLVERNGGYLNEDALGRMLLDDSMLSFYKQNVLKVKTDLVIADDLKSVSLGRVNDFCQLKEKHKPSKRITRRTVIDSDDEQDEEPPEREFSIDLVVAKTEELYELAPVEDSEDSEEKESSTSTLSDRCCRQLIDLMFIIENMACSLCNVRNLSTESFFDADSDSSSVEDLYSDDENSQAETNKSHKSKSTKKKPSKPKLAEKVNKYFKQYEDTSAEVKFEPLLIEEGAETKAYDVVGFDHSSFTHDNPKHNIESSFYKISRRDESTDKIKMNSIVKRLEGLSQTAVSEEDMLEGMTLAEEEGKTNKLLSSVVRKDFDKAQVYYKRIWRYYVKRELWLETVENLFRVKSVSAASLAVAQLSAAIFNNKTKQIFTKKILRKKYVPVIDGSMS